MFSHATMIIFAALIVAPRPIVLGEPTCVMDEIEARATAGKPSPLADATELCRKRFSWTNENVESAPKVARALVFVRQHRAEARAAGVDLVRVDAVFDRMSGQQRAAFGWEGDRKPIPDAEFSAALDQLRDGMNYEQFEKAGLIIVFQSIAHNTIQAFIDHRLASAEGR